VTEARAVRTGDGGRPLPEFVVVPARPGPGGPRLETRCLAGGARAALPAFSSVAGLVARLGRGQPWVCLRLAHARGAAAAAGLACVVIDPGGPAAAGGHDGGEA
jgi:hypothetical protein